MAGFKNTSLNSTVKQNYYEQIIQLLKSCSDFMVLNGVKIQNHEEKISSHIVQNYLMNKEVVDSIVEPRFPFSFLLEVPENFDSNKNIFVGRADIQVISLNYFLRENIKDYYTIECKRIDGTTDLNEKYITQGVARFVVPPIKYKSYHNKNIMFGYIVKSMVVPANIQKINTIHKAELTSYISKDITYLPNSSTASCYICESGYNIENKYLLLSHIFYDFSSIIV